MFIEKIMLGLALSTGVMEEVNEQGYYVYEVTEVDGNEIHGKNILNIGKYNGGIFLYKDEVNFDIKPNDKILVQFGEEEDIILNVTKLK